MFLDVPRVFREPDRKFSREVAQNYFSPAVPLLLLTATWNFYVFPVSFRGALSVRCALLQVDYQFSVI